jgi:hypothetical protein
MVSAARPWSNVAKGRQHCHRFALWTPRSRAPRLRCEVERCHDARASPIARALRRGSMQYRARMSARDRHRLHSGNATTTRSRSPPIGRGSRMFGAGKSSAFCSRLRPAT